MAVAPETNVPHYWWAPLDYSVLLYDQHIGMSLSDADLHEGSFYEMYYIRPRTRDNVENSGVSQVINDDEKFKATLDVRNFSEDDIRIRLVGNIVEVHAQHSDKQDDCGVIRRGFCRKYLLPPEVEPRNVKSTLINGILTIEGPKEPPVPLPIDVEVVSEQQDIDKASEDTS